MSSLEFNVENFFNDLIFHPWHGAQKEDKNKAWIASLLFGLFTLAIGHTLVGIYQLGRYVWSQYVINSEKTDSNSTNEKMHYLAKQHDIVPQTNVLIEKNDSIPKQVEKLVSDLSDPRDSTSEGVDFGRSNPEALAKPESQLFNLFGYKSQNIENKLQEGSKASAVSVQSEEKQSLQKRAALNDFSDDTITEICHLLTISDLNNLAQVCKNQRIYANQVLIERAFNYGFEKKPTIINVNKFFSSLFNTIKLLSKENLLPNTFINQRNHQNLKDLTLQELTCICYEGDKIYRLQANVLHKRKRINIKYFTKLLSRLNVITPKDDKLRCLLIKNINLSEMLLEATKAEDVCIVKLLLDQKIDPNIMDKNGNSSLHYAAQKGDFKIVQLLVERKAMVNVKGEGGNTPLFFAIKNNKIDVAKFLLDNGADSIIRDDRGNSFCVKNILNIISRKYTLHE